MLGSRGVLGLRSNLATFRGPFYHRPKTKGKYDARGDCSKDIKPCQREKGLGVLGAAVGLGP